LLLEDTQFCWEGDIFLTCSTENGRTCYYAVINENIGLFLVDSNGLSSVHCNELFLLSYINMDLALGKKKMFKINSQKITKYAQILVKIC